MKRSWFALGHPFMSGRPYCPWFHVIPNTATLPRWPPDYRAPASLWHFFWCMESASAVPNGEPVLAVPVSSLGAILWAALCVWSWRPGQWESYFKIRPAVLFPPRAVIKDCFDVETSQRWAQRESLCCSAVTLTLFSVHFLNFFFYFCCFAFFPSRCGIRGVCGMPMAKCIMGR